MIYRLPASERRRLVESALAAWPRECCGLIFADRRDRRTLRLEATAGRFNRVDSFHISSAEVAVGIAAGPQGPRRLLGCFHSHPVGHARPSSRDRDTSTGPGALWLVISVVPPGLGLFEWTGRRFRRVPLAIIRRC